MQRRQPAPTHYQHPQPMIPPAPPRSMPQQRLPVNGARPTHKRRLNWWLIAPVLGVVGLMAAMVFGVVLVVGLAYAGGILPGVHAGGIALGGQSQAEASNTLQNNWQSLLLRDGERTWAVNPVLLGIFLDPAATADAAYQQGRGSGSAIHAILGQVDVSPIVNVDLSIAESGLRDLALQFELPSVNAGVRLVNGQVEATPPVEGRALDYGATLAMLQQDVSGLLADGELDLVMTPVQPAVLDASSMVAQASQLLSSFLDIRVYDPMTDDTVYWSLPPEQWGMWLAATPDEGSVTGLALTIDETQAAAYLSTEADSTFDASRYIKMDEAVNTVQQVVANGQTEPFVRVYHHDGQHTVQAGETIISIAWDYGVPYPWIQQANPGVDVLSAGQTITIPSVDNFLPYPVIPDKRIVVSISQQHAWIYERGDVKWDWPVSTGISSSPTWPGIYQIQSHEPNAYAANWNLWMPNFMGVYQPIPGSDFTNGLHGFPTRGGSQLLWTDSLGTRVTYGCILLSNDNIQALYNWAEEGVVVEIQA
jgi:lipoprotein-anchoring transpeptidase ErfK/SrfK